MKAQSLPNEILIQIFERLPRPTVYQCLFVCKAWETAAVQQFYQQVLFSAKMMIRMKNMLRPKKRSTKQVVTRGELARNLKLSHDYSRELSQDELISWLSYMPYLKKINMTKSYYQQAYLKAIFDKLEWNSNNNITTGFLDRIEDLQVLPNVGSSSVDITKEYKVCYALRRSLKHLHLLHFE